MKRTIQLLAGVIMLMMVLAVERAQAQKLDEERMTRDVKVAENVLATLIKQKFDGKRMFFPLSVTGTYQEGYGVTFSLPADYTTPIIFSFPSEDMVIIDDAQGVSTGEYRVQRRNRENDREFEWTLKDRRQANMDSLRDISNEKIIEAAKEFLADYGDMISQLKPEEKIVITNRGGNQPRMWVTHMVKSPGRNHLSIEMLKADLNSFRQNKLTRDQLLNKITVVNAEAVDEAEPDLELLSTIFSRLYRQDLSKTFFSEGNIYYERLKDFGAVYYMHTFSSNRTFNGTYDMPTVDLRDVDQATRDKKVKELYPLFEQELKENIVEYGRTVKSLGDDEVLAFNVRLTQCTECGIPSTLEVSVKSAVLKEYGNGKIDKNTALGKVQVKRGSNQ